MVSCFNLRRLQAKSKAQKDVLDPFLYADDMAENAKTERKMLGAMDRVAQQVCANNGLTISTNKTEAEVVCQP